MPNVVELIPADEDWKPKTAMDRVYCDTIEYVNNARDAIHDAASLEEFFNGARRLHAAFENARAKGSRLTP